MTENHKRGTLDQGRTLTKAEQRRMERLDALTEKLESEGYKRKDLTVSLLEANVKGPLLALPFLAAEIALHIAVRGSIFHGEWVELSWLWLAVFFLLIPVHELIHGLTWGLFADHHMKDIEFGVVWKMLTPYCTCSSPLSRHAYLLGGAMPTIILGFGLFAISLVNGSVPLYLLSLLMTLCGCGDMLILYTLLRYKSDCRDILVYDHPYEGGSIIFERN